MPTEPAKPEPNPRGIFCPDCRGVRLHVESVRHPCAGRTVRYYRCTACDAKVITEETVSRTRRPRGAEPSYG